ncbi:Uncharacterised protein [Citrobacter koseri]|uniref:Uncharacterized protein n=1 Tax=Citrobacter koseri TaxID=545 RepID=A0A447UQ39_CITKO|nr:Uncharacterised protein [Citrobacter koseri]
MIRFTSTELRPLLSQQGGMQRPLLLEKNLGIYIRVPDDRNPGEWLRHGRKVVIPRKMQNWSENADLLIPGKEYAFQTFIEQSKFDAVLTEHHDLFMMPSAGPLGTGMTIRKEDPSARKGVCPGGGISQQYSLALRSVSPAFTCLCGECGTSELALAGAVCGLNRVIRLDCKRAKPADRAIFESAVRSVRSSVSEVMSDALSVTRQPAVRLYY